ncbi:type II toxin-antitoxin system ParD family antitoxin [Chenggangzhangella methanolivorans]|uniref:Type II toxin-antitoxin system ParD family antitoxin n=1 Tax=Chenggangzhangella methanolivorans TaxID=1437009 RepID=A0A9E6UQF4_9HYPH|nr:type II toxin-antitoxin system ParD family antitoxin [Chenggangzhangella methanolivorans]QZO00875.1 type II toxin-antitoxin system ParD family antitoxin [Chenggangzhangella methanolivorans]
MSAVTINLTGELAAFVEDRVARGYSHSANEAVAEGLRLLREEQNRKLEALKAAINEGVADIEAGQIYEGTIDDILNDVLNRKRS